jgi:hypothetical protein
MVTALRVGTHHGGALDHPDAERFCHFEGVRLRVGQMIHEIYRTTEKSSSVRYDLNVLDMRNMYFF